jgi:hypothetical protein
VVGGRQIVTMCARQNSALPHQHALDYESLLHDARLEGATKVSLYLRQHLPFRWRNLYVAAVSRPTNIVRIQRGTFEYFLDIYSELEMK